MTISRSRCMPGFTAALLCGIIAYTPAAGQSLYSLDDCIRIALEHSVGLGGIEKSSRSTALAHEEEGKGVLPQFHVEGRAWNAPNSDHFGYDPAVTDGGQFSAQLGVQELLYDGGARGLRQDQLAGDMERLGFEKRRLERDIRYSVTSAHIDVLASEEEIRMQQSRVDELTSYLELVNRLFHGGGINFTDVLKTQVSMENARSLLRSKVQESAMAKVSLAEAMGMPEDTSFILGAGPGLPDSASIAARLAGARLDSSTSLDLQIVDFAVRRSLVDVDIARSERLPNVSLNGDVGWLSSGDNLRLPADQRVTTFGYSLGISIDNLLFNWGTTDLRVQQRQLDAENTRLGYEQLRRSLSADLLRVRHQVQGAFDLLQSLRRTLRGAEDNYTLTKAQYAGGGTTAFEVLAAEQLLADTRASELQTRAELRRALARLEQLTAR